MTEVEEAREMLNESVPDSTRLKWALKQLGKQLSYIEELEDSNKALKKENRMLLELTKDERKELKKTEQYKLLKEQHRSLRTEHYELMGKYNQLKAKHNENT